jgi:hypothetical protein
MKRFPSVAVLSVLASIGLLGCGSEPKEECTARAAFQLSVRAHSGHLPPDTKLTVKYGGGEETYSLADLTHDEEAVLCDAEGADAGDGGTVSRLVCALWTQGVASVTIEASGYDDVERTLEAEAENDCIRTVPVELVLGDQDGGT